MRNRIPELQARLDALRSEIDELDGLDSPTDEQTARFGAALDEFESIKVEADGEIARQARLDAVRATALADPSRMESGFGAAAVIVRNDLDPFENMDGIRTGLVSQDDLVARALTAIESAPEHMSDGMRERATELAQGDPLIARHILLTGSPEYHRSFREYLRNPSARASMGLTDANGGYLVPFTLDPTIVLTNDGTANPFRMISRVETTATDTWNGVTSAGVTAEWLAESTEAADASPTTGNIAITPVKGFATVNASFELIADSNIGSQLPRLFQDAKDRLEGTAFATGSGSGAPKGIITAVTAVTASRVAPTTGGAFAAASEVYKLIEAVPPRQRSAASWVANFAILNKIRQFDTTGGSALWAYLGADVPPNLLGRPVYESSAMASAVTTGSNVLLAGDFSEFIIVDRVGMSVLYDPNVKGSNGRPKGEGQWSAFWRVGSDVANVNAFRVLKL